MLVGCGGEEVQKTAASVPECPAADPAAALGAAAADAKAAAVAATVTEATFSNIALIVDSFENHFNV